ncbi:MAG: YaaC family protein [Nitrospira sp.]
MRSRFSRVFDVSFRRFQTNVSSHRCLHRFPSPEQVRRCQISRLASLLSLTRVKPRIVTADPWAFLNHLVDDRLSRSNRSAAFSYINQAFDFFEAARNPQIGSKSLLYYYSFLNLVKTA